MWRRSRVLGLGFGVPWRGVAAPEQFDSKPVRSKGANGVTVVVVAGDVIPLI
jgi:hypothetical protein